MKKLAYIFTSCLLLAGLNGCTDDFDEINTNPNKMYEVEFDQVFAGTVKRTLDMFGQENRERWLNFSRYAYLTYAITPSQDEGGRIFQKAYVQVLRDMEILNDKYYGKPEYANRRAIILTWKSYIYYMLVSTYGPVPMSDAIVQGEEIKRSYKYDTEEEIYLQILEDLASADTLYNASTAYLNDLKFPDVVFGSAADESPFTPRIANWKKFANTFRLHIAMHARNAISPANQAILRQHVQELMAQPEKLIASASDIVAPHWGSDSESAASTYYNAYKGSYTLSDSTYPGLSEYLFLYLFSYNDARLGKYALKSNAKNPAMPVYLFTDTITRPHECTNSGTDKCAYYNTHRTDGKNTYRRDSIVVQYTTDWLPMTEQAGQQLPTGWAFVTGESRSFGIGAYAETGKWEKEVSYNYRDNIARNDIVNLSYVRPEFLAESASIVMLSWADACFLKAEATLWLGGAEADAKKYYEDGIRASFAQYGITNADTLNTYLSQPGIAWRTNGHGYASDRQLYRANINGADNPLEQIYKQRYIADFFNGLEGWNLERRTRVMRFPPFFLRGQSASVEGLNTTYNWWTERYIYPLAESMRNSSEYYSAVEKLRATSPFTRNERWGDNVFTSLSFTTRNPDMEYAEQEYLQARMVKTYCEYFRHLYGETYEEIRENAYQKLTGASRPDNAKPLDDSKALQSAYRYAFVSRLCWYYHDLPTTP
jgi:hypothetical protein